MFGSSVFAQQTRLTGNILDGSTGKGIGYAIIRLISTSESTCTNSEGRFEIPLSALNVTLIVSCIGYEPDTLTVSHEKKDINIYLKRTLPQLKTAKRNKILTASEIVGNAISVKEKMYTALTNYNFDAYIRCVTRENNEVGLGTGSINLNPGIIKGAFNLISNIWESKPMLIGRIDEFTSKDFYKNPGSYTEIVEEQNPRSGLPSTLKTLLGTRRIQNLSGEELLFFDRQLPGPVSSGALSYYRYYFEDTLQYDHENLYKIHFEPFDNNDPGLIGSIFITDSSGCIINIEATLNRAANTGNIFDSISLTQQFISCKNQFNLPVNYRMLVNSDYIGIVKVRYDYDALIENYKINTDDTSENTGDEELSFVPENGKRDSVDWKNLRQIPFTQEEANAYKRMENSGPNSGGFFYSAAKIFSPQYRLSDHFSISGPLTVYQFNHVEGQTISLSGYGNNLFGDKVDTRLNLSDGFSDRRLKENFSGIYNVDNKRTIKLSANIYNKLETLFSSSDRYNSLTTTIFSLFSRYDFRSYYYKKGFDLRVDTEILHILRLYGFYSNHVDHSAKTNTTFSLFGGRQRNFNTTNNFTFADSVNPPIYDTRLNTVSFGFNFDFRNNVVENNLRRKVSNGNSFVSFGAGMLISSPKFLGSGIGFVSYNSNILGELNTFGTSSLGIEINGIYSNGPVPIQMQYALPGNINATGRDFTFRTLGVGKMFGDQVLTLNLEYNVRKELYRVLPFSFLRNFDLTSFFNSAWKNMSHKSAAIMPVEFSLLTKPLLETGFSIGYSSLPVNIEFAWRLTHIDRSSFRVGINTSIL